MYVWYVEMARHALRNARTSCVLRGSASEALKEANTTWILGPCIFTFIVGSIAPGVMVLSWHQILFDNVRA